MSQSKIQPRSSDSTQELGDETFMSANELRNYMTQTEMARRRKTTVPQVEPTRRARSSSSR